MNGTDRAPVTTRRLTLVPGTVELACAELGDRAEFGRLLQAAVPDNWPPESAADALPLFLGWLEASPGDVGWYGWYALDGTPTLVGGGGFLGPPNEGEVQLGYSMLPQFQGRGYATELVEALVRWAFGHSAVSRIVAETEWANPASVRVLAKAGFVSVRAGPKADGAQFELRRAESATGQSHRDGL